jgi:glc operon protein GlcG
MAYYGDPRFVGWGGGVPVIVAGNVVGSIAVSGLVEAEDMEVAGMAAASLVEAIEGQPAS